jgi:hypothetical protein
MHRKSKTIALILLFLIPRFCFSDYISAKTFEECCQFVVEGEHYRLNPSQVRDGDAIYVRTYQLDRFFKTSHPRIRARYILVTQYSDLSVPGPHAAYLDDPKLIAWFAINIDHASHPKLIPIPIGLDKKTTRHPGEVNMLNQEKERAKTTSRTIPLYMNFKPWPDCKERTLVYDLFRNHPLCVWQPKKSLACYMHDLAQSRFVLSPRGLGLDCYRTWEALYMGAIPILKTSAMDKLFVDLPVLIVEDWNVITEDFLAKKWEEIQSKHYNLEKLSPAYWKRLIDSYRGRS